MDDQAREAIRAKVREEDQKMKDGLAVFFLGKHCPLLKEECRGPECPFFLVSGEEQSGRRVISGGNCSIPLIASQVGPIGDGLAQLAMVAATPKAPQSPIIPVRK